MGKTDEITSVCSKCGDSFQLKVPILCQSCESKTKSEHFNIICTSCNRRLKESDSIYCTNCFNNKCRELDGITSSYQDLIDEGQSKLILIEIKKADITEVLRDKENLINKLENQNNHLKKRLEAIHNKLSH